MSLLFIRHNIFILFKYIYVTLLDIEVLISNELNIVCIIDNVRRFYLSIIGVSAPIVE